MVAVYGIGVYGGILYFFLQAISNAYIINAPALVLCPHCGETPAPPTVAVGLIWVNMPKGVNKAVG